MRQLLRPAAAVAALAALTACGIQETDVIGASGPATIDVLPARQVRMLLFFLSPDGVLIPVPRIVGGGDAAGFGEEYTLEADDKTGSADPGARPPTVKTIAALVAGPQEAERRAGLRNDPSLTALAADARISPAGDTAVVVVAAPLGGLTEPARRQLVCTIAYAESPDGGVIVALRGTDGALAPERCDTWLNPARTRTPSKTPTPGVAEVDPS
ncbi:hypothetical protein ACFWFI_18480 [Streptomyces sp. NPDC060209]|uniref:hypothetical protein n=1 Tax=Streptomyces sp. NPDC060209 TaxID=3347073 RepID=UPI00364E0EAC